MSTPANSPTKGLSDSLEDVPDVGHPGLLERVTNIIGVMGGVGILLLLVHVVADVVSRFAFNAPINGTLEIAQYWYMPIIVFLGLGMAERTDQHISAPIVYDRLRPALKLELSAIALLLSLLLLCGYAWFGLQEALVLMRQGAAGIVSQIPIWPSRFLVPLGSLLLAAEMTSKFLVQVKTFRTVSRKGKPE